MGTIIRTRYLVLAPRLKGAFFSESEALAYVADHNLSIVGHDFDEVGGGSMSFSTVLIHAEDNLPKA